MEPSCLFCGARKYEDCMVEGITYLSAFQTKILRRERKKITPRRKKNVSRKQNSGKGFPREKRDPARPMGKKIFTRANIIHSHSPFAVAFLIAYSLFRHFSSQQ